MLRDVLLRTHSLGEEIGCRGLLVHAETVEARDFYLHLVPEFDTSPTDDMLLHLLMKDIRRTLDRGNGDQIVRTAVLRGPPDVPIRPTGTLRAGVGWLRRRGLGSTS